MNVSGTSTAQDWGQLWANPGSGVIKGSDALTVLHVWRQKFDVMLMVFEKDQFTKKIILALGSQRRPRKNKTNNRRRK